MAGHGAAARLVPEDGSLSPTPATLTRSRPGGDNLGLALHRRLDRKVIDIPPSVTNLEVSGRGTWFQQTCA